MVNYLGHGGPDRLGNNGLLLTGDVAALANAERSPILTALTCSVGRFDLPAFDTLSETLLLHDAGGVVALWSPSSLSFNAEARSLGDAFLRAGFGTAPRLGDAARAALAEYAAGEEVDAYLPFVLILLGDPAIQLAP